MAIAIAHQQTSTWGSYNPTNTFTPTSSIAAGALVSCEVIISCGTGFVVTGISGGGVATWIELTSALVTQGDRQTSIWYGYSSGGTASITVTGTPSAGTGGKVFFKEYSGGPTSGTPTDGVSSHTGSTIGSNLPQNPGSITPTASTAVLVLSSMLGRQHDTTGTYPPTGFTASTGSSPLFSTNPAVGAVMSDYQTVSSASGSYSPQYTVGPYESFCGTIVAFKSGGGSPPAPKRRFWNTIFRVLIVGFSLSLLKIFLP